MPLMNWSALLRLKHLKKLLPERKELHRWIQAKIRSWYIIALNWGQRKVASLFFIGGYVYEEQVMMRTHVLLRHIEDKKTWFAHKIIVCCVVC